MYIDAKIKYRDCGIGTDTAALTLSDSYQAGNVMPVPEGDQVVLLVEYTPGDNTRAMTVKVEFGDTRDTQNFFELSIGSDGAASGGVINTTVYANRFKLPGATDGTTYTFRLPVSAADKFIKVSAIEDGSADFGTAYIQLGARGV